MNSTTLFGNNMGSVHLGDGDQTAAVAVGSRAGANNVYGHGVNLQAGNGAGDGRFAQLGFQVTDGVSLDGTNLGVAPAITGPITVHVREHVTAAAGDMATHSYAQVGHVGADHGGLNTTVEAATNAPIEIAAAGDIVFTARDGFESYAQLGHGGESTDGNHAGDITITHANDLIFTGGGNDDSYAQLGNGGDEADGDHSGEITITRANDLIFTGGTGDDSYAQLGHGGDAADGNHSGNIVVDQAKDLVFTGNGDEAAARLGHGGDAADGNHSGDITIAQANNLTFTAGAGEDANAQLGHGGDAADGNLSGNITIALANNLTFIVGTGEDAIAQLGHGAGNNVGGDYSGTIDLLVGGALNLTGQDTVERYAIIGHGDDPGNSDAGNTVSGDILVRVGDEANLTGAFIGHLIDPDGTYTSGNTFIEVVNSLTTDDASAFNSALDAAGGELRIYIGDVAADNVDPDTLLNGVAHGLAQAPNNQGAFAFGDGPYVPDFSYYTIPTSGGLLYFSSNSGGSVGGVDFEDEDVLVFDVNAETFDLFFDGSDVGIDGNLDVDAFYIEDDGSILLSLGLPTNLPGIGAVEDEDVFRFTPAVPDDYSAGTFAPVFDGSAAGLTAQGNSDLDVDSVARAPSGDLIISLTANFVVNGGSLTGGDEDLLLWNSATNQFELFLDGSTLGLTNSGEDVTGAWVDPASGETYLTTLGLFSASGLAGDSDDVFVQTGGPFELFFDGDDFPGLGLESLDALALVVGPPTPQADLSVTKTDSADPILTGGSTLYTVVVTNNGPDDVTGASLVDTVSFPTGTFTVSDETIVFSGGGNATVLIEPDGPDITNLSLANGETATLSFIVTVDSGTGTITNTATVSGGTPSDPNAGNDSQSETTTVAAPQADLEVTKSDSADPILTGGSTLYTVVVTNNGPLDVSGAALEDTVSFPTGTFTVSDETLAFSGAGSGTLVTEADGPDVTDLILSSGETATLTFTVTVDSGTGTITNNATVSGGTPSDPDAGNDSQEETTTVAAPQADLQVTKSDSADPIAPGGSTEYTVVVTNNGPLDVTGASLVDTVSFPTGTFTVSDEALAFSGSGSGALVVEADGPDVTGLNLSSGETATLTFTVTVDSGTGTITNNATVSGGTPSDPDTGNDTASEETLVQEPPDDLLLYLSSNSGGNVDGIVFADEDVLAYNPATDTWQMVFDGSDVGLASVDVDAVHVNADGTILLSVGQNVTVAGLGEIDDS